MKSEIQDELELQKIQIEETSCNVGHLKTKLCDLVNPKKSFDESDLMASSLDVTKTPFSRKFLSKISPVPEYAQYVNEEDEGATGDPEDHKTLPNSSHEPVDVNDVTLYEDIVLQDADVNVNMLSVGNPHKTMTSLDQIEHSAFHHSSAENQIIAGDFGGKLDTFSASLENVTDTYTEIPARKRRESLMSSLFINVASFLDV